MAVSIIPELLPCLQPHCCGFTPSLLTMTTTTGSPITTWTANQLSQAIHAKAVSCREVMQAYLQRIAAVNPQVNAIVSLQSETALLAQADLRDAQLARGESMGWMHGMPQAVKDLSNVAGLPTSSGSPLQRHFVPQEDGLMASRLRAAGCIFIGKTNVPEFGLGSHTFNTVFGATRNPWNLAKTAGGSSGGAAAALATHMLPVADGSDFMGSLRNPAGWCNVVGMRPSQGRVPMWPVGDVFISQLGTEGPMGRNVEDVAKLLEIQSGYAKNSPLSIADYWHFKLENNLKNLEKIKIGWLGDLNGYLPMEDGILQVCQLAVQRLQGAGCLVEPASLGSPEALDKTWQAWLVWRRALVAGRLAPYLANPAHRAQLKPEALWEVDQAAALKGTELMAASSQRTAFYQQMLQVFETYDFLLLPSAQVWPFDIAERWPQTINGHAMDTYHRWMEVTIYATFAGLPAICMPAGFGTEGAAKGLPMGLQIIGKPQADAAVLQLAQTYEAASGGLVQRRPAGL